MGGVEWAGKIMAAMLWLLLYKGETLNIHWNLLAMHSCKVYRNAEDMCLCRPTIVFDLHWTLKGIIIIIIITTQDSPFNKTEEQDTIL